MGGQLEEMRHQEVVGIVEGDGGRRWTMRGRIWRKWIFIWYGLCTIRLGLVQHRTVIVYYPPWMVFPLFKLEFDYVYHYIRSGSRFVVLIHQGYSSLIENNVESIVTVKQDELENIFSWINFCYSSSYYDIFILYLCSWLNYLLTKPAFCFFVANVSNDACY